MPFNPLLRSEEEKNVCNYDLLSYPVLGPKQSTSCTYTLLPQYFLSQLVFFSIIMSRHLEDVKAQKNPDKCLPCSNCQLRTHVECTTSPAKVHRQLIINTRIKAAPALPVYSISFYFFFYSHISSRGRRSFQNCPKPRFSVSLIY